MKPLFSDTRILDECVRQEFHVTTDILMENAAMALETAVLSACKAQNPCFVEKSVDFVDVLIVAGSGDNGGDGYALARRLAAGTVSCALFAARQPKSPACVEQKLRADAAGSVYAQKLVPCRVLVDCLFGSGFHGAPDTATATLVSEMNALSAYKIACDVPSCLSAAVSSDVVFRADETVTMGALKTQLYEDYAKDYVGKVTCASLGVQRALFESNSENTPTDVWLLEKSDLILPKRIKKNTHKGSYGHAAVIVGEKCGAGLIAGRAAFGFGAGLVTLVSAPDEATPIQQLSELLTTGNQTAVAESLCMLMNGTELPANTTAVAFGMGFGRSEKAEERAAGLYSSLIEKTEIACLIDADACYYEGLSAFLAARSDASRGGCRTVLTPHPKEFCALLEICGLGVYSVSEIMADRLRFVRLFCETFPGIALICKGANSLIAVKQDALTVVVNPFGTAALAKGGSGDVLSGLTVALLAQGYDAFGAAKQASLAHALASRLFETHSGNYALTPFSLIEEISRL